MSDDPKHTNMTCDQLLGLLSDYLDGQSREDLCRDIEQHMSECRNCRIVVDTTRKTISLVHASNHMQLDLPEDIRERLFKRLNLDDYLKPQKAS